jgi:hypothetical protein
VSTRSKNPSCHVLVLWLHSEIAVRNQDLARRELQMDRDLRLEEMKAHKLTKEWTEVLRKEKVRETGRAHCGSFADSPPRNLGISRKTLKLSWQQDKQRSDHC